MTRQRIALTGDWQEGIEIIQNAVSGSPYEPLLVPFNNLKAVVKKKQSDVFVFCIKGASQEVVERVQEIKLANDALPVFLFSRTADVDFVVQNIKNGVADFFVRPLNKAEFLKRIERELHLYQLTRKVFMTQSALDEYRFENIIGRSRVMQDNFQMIAAVAKSNATVLITGESGVGKELVAQAIHKRSPRVCFPFIDINCGAIPRELLENELFGHEKGSFTGAHKRYQGSFEAASRGTLFMDEISEMDVLLQVKLLRALQERTITRIGSNESIRVDVRFVVATNKNLAKLIEEGKFREDLYYRLNVVNIEIPALRDRREDIPLLARHFLEYCSAKNDKIFLDFSNEAMEMLINFDWPGNVRELENTIERIVVLHDSSQVKPKHLPEGMQKVNRSIAFSDETILPVSENHVVPLEELERRAIETALMKFRGNVGVAAKKLNIGQATLYRKVKKFGLQLA